MYNILPTIQQSIVFVVVGETFTELFLKQSPSWKRLTLLPLFHSWGCSRPELWWAGLVTWIIQCIIDTSLRNSVLFSGATVVFVHEAKATCVASSSCPTIVPHWQFCKLLTMAVFNHPTCKKVLQSFKVGFWIWHSHVIMRLRSSHHRPEVNNQPRAGLDWVAGFLWSKPSTKLPPLSTSGSKSYTDPRWSVKTIFCLLNYFYELATF